MWVGVIAFAGWMIRALTPIPQWPVGVAFALVAISIWTVIFRRPRGHRWICEDKGSPDSISTLRPDRRSPEAMPHPALCEIEEAESECS